MPAKERESAKEREEALEDESGLDVFTLLASSHWESHLPSLKEKWNDLGDLGFEEN